MVESEKRLIELCQKWDNTHFTYFFDTYFESVYKFIYLKTFDTQVAQDITSDVFLKALTKIQTFKIQEWNTFKSWIFKIAYNTVIDYYRTNKQEPSLEEVVEKGYNIDFAENVDKKDTSKKIMNFLDTLEPRAKKIIIMRFWDELSFKEIAQIVGESEDNCKKIVYRNIQKLDTSTLVLLLLFFNMF